MHRGFSANSRNRTTHDQYGIVHVITKLIRLDTVEAIDTCMATSSRVGAAYIKAPGQQH